MKEKEQGGGAVKEGFTPLSPPPQLLLGSILRLGDGRLH